MFLILDLKYGSLVSPLPDSQAHRSSSVLEWGAALGVPWPIIGMDYLEGRNMAGYTGNANKKACLSFIHLWGSLNYPYVGDQTMQIYGTFEGFSCIIANCLG